MLVALSLLHSMCGRHCHFVGSVHEYDPVLEQGMLICHQLFIELLTITFTLGYIIKLSAVFIRALVLFHFGVNWLQNWYTFY